MMSDKPGQPSVPKPMEYRDANVDEDEDDLDDLDAPAAPTTDPTLPIASPPTAKAVDEDEDFEASLVEGMESLLRQLAGDHPPGPMPDSENHASQEGEVAGDTIGEAPPLTSVSFGEGKTSRSARAEEMSPEEEEAAWQKAVETLLSGEGLEALGLNGNGSGSGSRGATAGASGSKEKGKGKSTTFEETIQRTMESLNAGGEAGRAGGSGGKGMNAELAELLKQLGQDPSTFPLDGLGDDGDGDGDDELGGLLDGMMNQLMTKEILEEPMTELAAKYPAYLASPPPSTSKAEIEKYKSQYALVQKILDKFHEDGYSDEKDGKEIARLVGEMQDLGGPPSEIMGELPEGFDLGALGGEEGCCIM